MDTDPTGSDGKAEMSTPTLTDSGLETWLIFHRGTDLPDFASFPLLDDPAGRELLAEYFREQGKKIGIDYQIR